MKRLFLILSLGMALTCGAENKYSASARYNFATERPSRSAEVYRLIVEHNPEMTAEEARAYGLTVHSWRSRTALLSGTKEQFDALGRHSGIRSMSAPQSLATANNLARANSGIDAIHIPTQGSATKSYTGAGVVTGLYDIGFDFEHPAFCTASGKSRIAGIYHVVDGDSIVEYSAADLPDDFKTDSNESSHGSHVLGTMASTHLNEYGGMAPGADIAIACGPLDDYSIAMGCDRIVQYAKTQNKPCVLNLSLANLAGPHDGTEPFDLFLSDLTEDAAIVVAAGNYAGNNQSVTHHFTPTDTAFRSFVYPISWMNTIHGTVGVWSDSSQPLTLKIALANIKDKIVLKEYEINPSQEAMPLVIATDDLKKAQFNIPTVSDSIFSLAFEDSYLAILPQVVGSGRHGYYLFYNITLRESDKKSHAFGIEVFGKNGQRADIYADGVYTLLRNMKMEGWSEGRDDMPLSSMACAKGIVSVGAYTVRNSFTYADGSERHFDTLDMDKIAAWSSYGQLLDGRKLPHVAAPGAAIVSLLSTPFHKTNTDDFLRPAHTQTIDGIERYWTMMYGTSQASPVVAGGIALWLEADPMLSSEEILDIISKTSNTDETTPHLAWGAGRFDAYAGLKEVLKRQSNLPELSVDNHQPLLEITGASTFRLTSSSPLGYVSVSDLSGRVRWHTLSHDNNIDINLHHLPHGLYLLRCGNHTFKLTIN